MPRAKRGRASPLISPSPKKRRGVEPLEDTIAALSPGSPTMTLAELQTHVAELAQQKDRFVLTLHQLLRRFYDDRRNRGVFNSPVDPRAQGIEDYFTKIPKPMCLQWVKSRLEEIFYDTPEEFCDDVRLVFANAMEYNPPGHPVHESAAELLREFEFEYRDFRAKILEEESKMMLHECEDCLGEPCALCRTKCSDFQAPVIRCGAPCKARIPRHSAYYRWGGDRGQHWCAKCFSQLPDVFLGLLGQKLEKSAVERCVNDETDAEPWTECSNCDRRMHAICALRNLSLPLGDWVCPLCILEDAGIQVGAPTPAFRGCHLEGKQGYLAADSHAQLEGRPSVRHSPRGGVLPGRRRASYEEETPLRDCGARGQGAPVTTSRDAASKTPKVEGLVPSASDLPHSSMGDYLERRMRNAVIAELLQKDDSRPSPEYTRETAALLADSLTLRVVSNVESVCPYEPRCSRFVQAQALSVHRPLQDVVLEYPHRSKTVLVFQRLAGVDVILFVLYVQEYGSDCPEPNANKVYISYLDSVGYMRPRRLRSVVYQEAMRGYFAWVKARGFKRIYVWACPPQRGDAYIIHSHPKWQRVPSSDRLRRWYYQVVQASVDEGVVVAESNLHDFHLSKFRPLVHTRHSTSRAKAKAARRAAVASSPSRRELAAHASTAKRKFHLERFPYFMGDFPVTEIETALSILEKQDGLADGTYDSAMRNWWLAVWGDETFARLKDEYAATLAKTEEATIPHNPIAWVVESVVPLKTLDVGLLDEASGSSASERDEWVMRRLSAAIKPMKENFLVLKLRGDSSRGRDSRRGSTTTVAVKKETRMGDFVLVNDTSDPDAPLPRTIFDTRLALLDMSQHKHLQFDQLRRAKNSSNVLLFFLYKSIREGLVIEDVEDLDAVEAEWKKQKQKK